MKALLTVILVVNLLGVTLLATADETESGPDILAKRGKGVVSQDEFDARAAKIPERYRLQTIRDRNRLRDLINGMLVNAQLAADAREAGFENNELVIERMKLAAQTELAAAWLQHYVASSPPADYEALANEYYLLHKDEMLSEEKVDVTHILVSKDERSYEEALEIANDIYAQLQENPGAFVELVEKYSDDSSAPSNKGSFKDVKRGDLVKPFEDVAFSLEPGQISEPVKTQYGYHIVRLDAYIAPEVQPFEQVKQQLVDAERTQHENRIRSDYISQLTSLGVEMSQENIEEMVRRQFGEDYVDPYTNN
jgi:parvulin-like peptidyl-prolyl isomerase